MTQFYNNDEAENTLNHTQAMKTEATQQKLRRVVEDSIKISHSLESCRFTRNVSFDSVFKKKMYLQIHFIIPKADSDSVINALNQIRHWIEEARQTSEAIFEHLTSKLCKKDNTFSFHEQHKYKPDERIKELLATLQQIKPFHDRTKHLPRNLTCCTYNMLQNRELFLYQSTHL